MFSALADVAKVPEMETVYHVKISCGYTVTLLYDLRLVCAVLVVADASISRICNIIRVYNNFVLLYCVTVNLMDLSEMGATL